MLTLDRQIDLVCQVLIAQHKYPEGDREEQKREIKLITQSLKALLHAKARKERIQKISNHNGGDSKNGSTRPADDTTGGICIRDILQKKIAGDRKRNNGSRKKEGYVQSRLGKHETKGW